MVGEEEWRSTSIEKDITETFIQMEANLNEYSGFLGYCVGDQTGKDEVKSIFEDGVNV